MRYFRSLLIVLVLLVNIQGFSQDHYKPSKQEFTEFCVEHSILYPEVVWAQAGIESGWFTSSMYRRKCNFLGLYDSRNSRYFSFDTWTDCLLAYRDNVQYRYSGPVDNVEHYLGWIQSTGYASDPEYLSKIRSIIRKY